MSNSQQAEQVIEKVTKAWQDPKIAETYARTEAATAPFAHVVLEKASVVANVAKRDSAINAFDFGCGTGAVTAALYDKIPKEKWANVKILGGDISEAMLSYLQERGEKNGWEGLSTQIVDGANIQLEPNQFTHIFANAIIFFLPLGTVPKLFDLLQPGGYIGVATWSALNWYPHVKRAIGNMADPPHFPSPEEVHNMFQLNNAWHEPSFVRQQLEEAGFQDVDVVQEKRNVAVGTPEQYCNAMKMPLSMFAAQWGEDLKGALLEELTAELQKVMTEVASESGDGQVYILMEANVGSGWKPSAK